MVLSDLSVKPNLVTLKNLMLPPAIYLSAVSNFLCLIKAR